MMPVIKKMMPAALVLVLLLGSFLLGSWFSRQGAEKVNPSGGKPPAGIVDHEPDTISDAGANSSSSSPVTVTVSPEKQQLIGVKVAAVEKAAWNSTLRLLGRVVPNENYIYRINAASDGWVKKILPITTGSLVKKNELLAVLFSPDFYSAIKGYINALKSLNRLEKSGKVSREQLGVSGQNIENYLYVLRNLGLSEDQLDEITRTQQWTDTIEIRAPEAGFILARNLSSGQRFEKGNELYRIADLSMVWIVADVFENEVEHLRPGRTVKVSLTNQGKTFQAKVTDVLPQFDEVTRTLKVRLEADNPGYTLRPNMFVDIELPIRMPPAIAVSADAVLDSGLKKTVFVDHGNGIFEPREVKTGWRVGNRVEIIHGLTPGERIVLSGNFLIDSETRLELVSMGMVGTLSKDPVCGTDVSRNKAEKAGRKVKVGKVTYYFCSDECKKQFEQNPARYAKKPQ